MFRYIRDKWENWKVLWWYMSEGQFGDMYNEDQNDDDTLQPKKDDNEKGP